MYYKFKIVRDVIFMILLFVLSINSQNTNAIEPVTVEANSHSESSANILVESRCYLGTAGEVIDKLTKLIDHYENLCSIADKKELTDYVNLARILGKLEADIRSSANTDANLEELLKLSPQFPFLNSIKTKNDLNFEDLFKKINDALLSYGHSANLPTYYVENVWRLAKYTRYLEILKVFKDLKVCMKEKELKIILDVTNDPTLNDLKCRHQISDEFKIDPMDFEENGIAIAFWAIEDATLAKLREITVIQGYINNDKVLDFTYLRGKESGEIINRFNINGETKEVVTKVSCTEYVFVLIAIERDCDHYKVSVTLRYPRENLRSFFQVKANANIIENMQLNYIKPPILTNPKIYKDFIYSLQEEDRIVIDTAGNIIDQLSLLSVTCGSEPNCHYYSTEVKKCEECKNGTFLSNGDCVETCPSGTYPESGECHPCQNRCNSCKSSDNCTDCNDPFFLLKLDDTGSRTQCVSVCPVGMIADENDECVKCTVDCTICKSTKECSECNPGFYLLEGNCVQQCPNGTYKDPLPKNECKPCAVGCDKCETLRKCDDCKENYFLKDGVCVKNCGDEYFANSSTEKCEQCSVRCKTCVDEKECQKCNEGYYLDEETKTCITDCKSTQILFKDVCISCGDRERCDECDPNNIQICKKCLPPWLLLDGNCVEKCGDGYYPNENGECKPCNTNCKTCTKDTCILCDDNHYLYKDRDCPSNCPDGYIISGKTCIPCKNVELCKKCSEKNQDICTECYLPKVLKEGRCELECGNNYWLKDNTECAKCEEGCSVCIDNYTCKKCDQGFFLKGNICVKDCGDGMVPVAGECKQCKVENCLTCPPEDLNRCNECNCDKVLYGNKCYDKCPSETYEVVKVKECENCSKDCLVCRDKDTCEKCKPPKVLQGTECKSICDDGFNDIDGVCKPCESLLCKKCDDTLKSCTECYTNHFLYQQTCVSPCPDGTFANGNECSHCQKPCEKCSESSDHCTLCIDGYAMNKDGKCNDDCPSGTIMDHEKRTCVDCLDKDCDKCDDKNISECIKCIPPMVLLNGNCYEVCPKGFFNFNGQCLPCVNGCKDCKSTTTCDVCDKGFLLKENICVTDCGDGWINKDGVCTQCRGNCVQCDINDMTHCTKCPEGLLLLDGKCINECPVKFWQDSFTCEPCVVKDCSKCSSKGATCESCIQPLLLNDNQCVDVCPDGKVRIEDKCATCHVVNCKTCPSTAVDTCTDCFAPSVLVNEYLCGDLCPSGSYVDKETRKCKKCIEPCNECDNSITCNKCNPGFYLEDGKCVENCKDGSRKDIDRCTPCDKDFCKKCTEKECLICQEPHVLLDNKCVDSCPSEHYYLDNNNEFKAPTCKPCNNFCKKCDNGLTCIECETPKLLDHDGKCVDNCKDGEVEILGKCVPCQTAPECRKCSDKDLTECIDCKDNFYLLNKKCVSDCGENHFEENNRCNNCIDKCTICHNEKMCDKCKDKFYLLDGVCIEECPCGTYPIEGKCLPCSDSNCEVCTSDQCKKCEEHYYLENGVCKKECSPGFYLLNFLECKKCDEHCISCINSNECSGCEVGYYLKNGKCVADCGSGYVASDSNCKPCEHGCDICAENNQNRCINCIQPKLLHMEQCVDVCPIGFFADDKHKECLPCIENCNLCSNKNTCDQCKENYLYQADLKQCVTVCSDGYRPDKSVCAPCQVQDCKKCDSNSQKCDDCNTDKFKLKDTCVPQCPDKGYYVDIETKECEPCSVECAKCINENECKECSPGFYLKDSTCVTDCDDGEAKVDGKCMECKTPNCSICPPTDLSVCRKCKDNEVLTEVITNGETTYKCSENCDEGLFPKEGKCESCIDKCSKCTDSKTCDTCKPGYLLENGICVVICSKGYVERADKCLPCEDKNCQICDNLTLKECKKCDLPTKLKDEKCVLDCEAGFFETKIDDMITCNPCVDNCNSCSNSSTCDICKQGTYLKDGLCVSDCGENSVIVDGLKCEPCSQKECKKCSSNNLDKCDECFKPLFMTPQQSCVPNCGDKNYERLVPSHACIPCTDSNCLLCSPEHVCKKCISPLVVFNNNCVEECHAGYYVDKEFTCQPCSDNKCAFCSAEHPEDCHECDLGWFLLNKKCVEKCPEGTFANDQNECQPCEARCKICNNASNCNICQEPFFLDQNDHCTDSCDKKFVKVEDKCQPCIEKDCLICDSKDTKTCLECEPNMFLNMGKCVPQCPDKTVAYGTNCVDCEKHCNKCIDINTCVECEAPTIEDNGDCVNECKTGYQNVNGHCLPCKDRDDCNKCKVDLTTCEECRAPLLVAEGKCIISCDDGFFYDEKLQKCVECTKNCSKCNNPNTCEKCKSPLFVNFVDGQCVEECPDKFTNIFYPVQKCVPCENDKCKKCENTNPSSCTSCFENSYLYSITLNSDKDCVPVCPNGFYPAGGACQHCNPRCETCTDDKTCQSCKPENYLLNNECRSECPIGYVNRNGVCYKCNDSKCEICDNVNLNQCLKCERGVLFNGLCIEKCPDGYRHDEINNTCIKCPEHCITCNINECIKCEDKFYFMENSKSCVDCLKPNLIVNEICTTCKVPGCQECADKLPEQCKVCDAYLILFEGKCISSCPDGYYKDGISCKKCSEGCAKCSDENCTNCDSSLVLIDGKCKENCPEGFTNINGVCEPCNKLNCLKCDSNISTCDKCKENLILFEGSCVEYCPDTFYLLIDKCIKCPDSCKKCDANGCNECQEPNKIKDRDCVPNCGEKYFDKGNRCEHCTDINCLVCSPENQCQKCNDESYLVIDKNKCEIICPDGTYPDNKTRECKPCETGCSKCTSDTCEECKPGFFYLKGQCVPQCPDKNTNDKGICVPCSNPNCLECIPENPDKCKTCEKGFPKYEEQCLPHCPLQTFKKDDDKCIDCDPKCAECNNSNTCTSCIPPLIWNNGQCENNCPDGKVAIDGKCVSCADENCKACSTDITNCLQCNDPFKLYEGTCQMDCPKGYFVHEGNCKQCSTGCEICNNETTCNTCRPGFFLENDVCVTNCPKDQFGDCSDHKCKKCDSSCDMCVGATSNDCVSCKSTFFKDIEGCVSDTGCRVGTYANETMKECSPCRIPLCAQCSNASTCVRCVSGMQLKDNKCIFSREIAPIIPNNEIISTTSLFSVPLDKVKGLGVSSSEVSFSFWARMLAPSQQGDNVIFSIQNFPGYNYSLLSDEKTGKCKFSVYLNANFVQSFDSVSCNFDNRYEWSFFYITISHAENSKDFDIGIHVLYNNQWEDTTAKLVNKFNVSEILVKTANFNFGYSINIPNMVPVQIYNFELMNYIPTSRELAPLISKSPPSCDYFCTKCDKTCQTCVEGLPPVDGYCQANGAYLINGLYLINHTEEKLVKEMFSINFASDRWAFNTWFYLENPNFSNKIIIVDFNYLLPGKEYNTISVSYENDKFNVDGNEFDIKLNGNTWYYLMIGVSRRNIKFILLDIKGNKISKDIPYKNDIEFLWMDYKVSISPSAWVGSVFNPFLYINNIPNDKQIEESIKALNCPDNCDVCTRDLSCMKCASNFLLNDGKCVDNSLNNATTLFSRVDLWDKNTFYAELNKDVTKNPFSISLWLRKKTHSDVTTNNIHNLLSLRASDNSIIPCIIETIKQDSQSELSFHWSKNTEVITHTFNHEVYDYYHVVIVIDPQAKTLKYNVNGANSINKVDSFPYSVTQVILGDNNGEEVNMEISLVNLYSVALNDAQIETIRNKRPVDCNPSCKECNLTNGECLKCHNDTSGLLCSIFLVGYTRSYIYGLTTTYDKVISKESFTNNLNNQGFSSGVNSLKYSVLSHIRFFQINSKEGERQRILSLGNYDITDSVWGREIIVLDLVFIHGSYNFEWNTNSSGNLKSVAVLELSIKPNNWYSVYASVDVVNKKFSYLIYDELNGKLYKSQSDLPDFPEKLQEYSALNLFGINDKLGTPFVVPSVQIQNAYFSVNPGEDETTFRKYRVSPAFQIEKDPVCDTSCSQCTYDNNKTVICLRCLNGFNLRNGVCESFSNNVYVVLSESLITRPTTYDLSVVQLTSVKPYSISFFFRTNYFNNSVIDLVSGFLQLTLNIPELGNVTLNLQNTISIQITKESLNSWTNVILSINDNEVCITVSNELNQSNISTQCGAIQLSNTRELSINTANYQFQFYGVSVVNNKIPNSVIDWPQLDCSNDCLTCVKNTCTSCIFGLDSSGKCKAQTEELDNKDTIASRVYQLKDLLRNNSTLRSRTYTVQFIFKNNINGVISSLYASKVYYFEISYNKGEIEFTYRHYQNSKVVKIAFPNSNFNNLENYVTLAFDNNQLNYLFFNSISNYVQGSIQIDNLDHLNPGATLEFSDKNARGIKLTYERAHDINTIKANIMSKFKLIQGSCLVGNNLQCNTCDKDLSIFGGFCVPQSGRTHILFANDIIPVSRTSTENTSLKMDITSTSINSLTLSFWWRLNSLIDQDQRIIQVALVSTQILTLSFTRNNSLELAFNWGQAMGKTILDDLLKDEEIFSWIHITTKTDASSGLILLFIYISKTNRTISKEIKVSSNTLEPISTVNQFFKVDLGNAQNANFEISRLMLIENNELADDQIEKMRPGLPISCDSPCKNKCTLGVCAVTDRITDPINIGGVYLEDVTLKLFDTVNNLTLFRPMYETKYQQVVNRYDISLELDVNSFLSSRYIANKDVLFVITDDNKSDYDTLSMNSIIPNSINNLSSISLNHRNGKLILNYQYIPWKQSVSSYELPLSGSLNDIQRLYISLSFNSNDNSIRVAVVADSMVTMMSLNNVLVSPLSYTALAYNHPSLNKFNLNLYKTDILSDTVTNGRDILFMKTSSTLNKCTSIDINCSQCINSDLNTVSSCLKCNDGFMFYNNACNSIIVNAK